MSNLCFKKTLIKHWSIDVNSMHHIWWWWMNHVRLILHSSQADTCPAMESARLAGCNMSKRESESMRTAMMQGRCLGDSCELRNKVLTFTIFDRNSSWKALGSESFKETMENFLQESLYFGSPHSPPHCTPSLGIAAVHCTPSRAPGNVAEMCMDHIRRWMVEGFCEHKIALKFSLNYHYIYKYNIYNDWLSNMIIYHYFFNKFLKSKVLFSIPSWYTPKGWPLASDEAKLPRGPSKSPYMLPKHHKSGSSVHMQILNASDNSTAFHGFPWRFPWLSTLYHSLSHSLSTYS